MSDLQQQSMYANLMSPMVRRGDKMENARVNKRMNERNKKQVFDRLWQDVDRKSQEAELRKKRLEELDEYNWQTILEMVDLYSPPKSK